MIFLLSILCLGACGVDYEGTRGECQEDGCSGDEPEDNCENNCDDPSLEVEYRFVLIEDTSLEVNRYSPGVDLDSIVLTKADGSVFYPTYVDDFNLAYSEEENRATNPESISGPPDDACQLDDTKFMSLGGQGGYVIVSFATSEVDVVIENGDSIEVHSIGLRDCLIESITWVSSSYSLSIGVSVATVLNGEFVVLGSGDRVRTFPVTGL